MTLRRGYVDGRFGQVHYWTAGDAQDKPPLYCLHATAYSGQTFLPLMEKLQHSRRVVALDTPGYGASDGPVSEQHFEVYAEALSEAISAIEVSQGAVQGSGHRADLFGYHTGALLATEMAALHPQQINAAVLMGVPYFTGETKDAWRKKLVHETALTESFDQFEARWVYFITNRTPGLSLERAFSCFVDELRAYPRDWWVHKALFDYAPENRLPLVKAPVLVVNTATVLAEASRDAARQIPNARVIELPQVGGAPFDLAPELLAQVMDEFLSLHH